MRYVLNRSPKDGNRPGVSVAAAMNAVGTIMRILVLKRTKKTKIYNTLEKKWITPGDDIPEDRWSFIDLANNVTDDKIYQSHFAPLHSFRIVRNFNKDTAFTRSVEDDSQNIDGGVERILALAASHLPICTLGRRLELIRYYRRGLDKRLAPLGEEEVMISKYDSEAASCERYP